MPHTPNPPLPCPAPNDYHTAMSPEQAQQLAQELLRGALTPEQFASRLASSTIADVGEAQVDLDRGRRCGYPEVVFAQGKSVAALEKIFRALLEHDVDVLATRVSAEQAAGVLPLFPAAHHNAVGRIIRIAAPSEQGPADHCGGGHIAILTAGTSDLPIAEEARETALWMGATVTMIHDVGVAGPQRLRARVPELQVADAIVVIAGMEGALPSVVGGYVSCPVIAVPTSVGYGASFGGVAALLGMLNSCASNVAVVNIDSGFKGAYLAGLIARRTQQRTGDGS